MLKWTKALSNDSATVLTVDLNMDFSVWRVCGESFSVQVHVHGMLHAYTQGQAYDYIRTIAFILQNASVSHSHPRCQALYKDTDSNPVIKGQELSRHHSADT